MTDEKLIDAMLDGYDCGNHYASMAAALAVAKRVIREQALTEAGRDLERTLDSFRYQQEGRESEWTRFIARTIADRIRALIDALPEGVGAGLGQRRVPT